MIPLNNTSTPELPIMNLLEEVEEGRGESFHPRVLPFLSIIEILSLLGYWHQSDCICCTTKARGCVYKGDLCYTLILSFL